MGSCSSKKQRKDQYIYEVINQQHNQQKNIQNNQQSQQQLPPQIQSLKINEQYQSHQQQHLQPEQVQQIPLNINSENNEQSERRAQQQINNNYVYQESLNSKQNLQQESSICKQCKEEDQNLIKLECNHFFHKDCLIKLLKNKNFCLCGKKIILIKKYVSQSIIDFIMKYRLQLIFKINQQKVQLLKCTNKNCAFFFVYDGKKNRNLSKEYYCNNCERMQVYDQYMCDFIEQQKIFYTDPNIGNLCYSCKQNVTEKDEANLDCKHKWHIQCLKEEVIKNLKYKCFCGQKINDHCLQIDKDQLESLKNKMFKEQLSRIINSHNIKFDICKQDCGFFWISDYQGSFIQNLIHCYECGYEEKLKVPKCYSCDKEYFGQHITLKNCQHKYHISCALKLVENKKNGVKIKCSCESLLDDQDFKTIGIQCMFCEKYDENLYKFKCQHHIHKQCLDDHYLEFINLTCCGITILDEISNKELEFIRNKIYDYRNGAKSICWKCGQKNRKLLKLDCEHFIDEQCLNELLTTEYLNNGTILCQCNQQISEDLILKIF